MVGFTKLQSSIIQSTIWRADKDTKILWITMLALSDKDGIVEGSIPGLADSARLSIEETEKALQNLMAADPYSRSKESGGRRIEEIDGGWFIINYQKYRAPTSTERVRKHRKNKKKEVGFNIADYDSCACCGKEFRKPHNLYVHLDHNHETKQTRAYICVSCNKIVGQYENGKTVADPDNIQLIERYLCRYDDNFQKAKRNVSQRCETTSQFPSDSDSVSGSCNTKEESIESLRDSHSSSLRSEEDSVTNNSSLSDKDSPLSLSHTDTLLIETDKDKDEKVKKYVYPSDFEEFWRLYPNHRGGKKAALEKWNRAKKAPQWPGLEAVLDSVESQKNSQSWKQENGQYIPMAQTWLNQGRWDSEERRRGAGYHEVLDKIERGEL